ncbi:CIA30 family protein [Halomonas sediminis]
MQPIEFQDPAEATHWQAVNDDVMGGVSQSDFQVENGKGIFHGELSLENGGGFASVRRAPHPPLQQALAGAVGVRLRVSGDGRTYQLRLKSHDLDDSSVYRARFTPKADAWETIDLPWQAFEAVCRGRLLSDAPTLDPARIHQLGFLIADRRAGTFRLQVACIEALNSH